MRMLFLKPGWIDVAEILTETSQSPVFNAEIDNIVALIMEGTRQ